MKVYKLKHIPTGLYFQSSKGNGNLSAKGKVYQTMPSLKWTKSIRIKFNTSKLNAAQQKMMDYFKIENLNRYGNWYLVDKNVKTLETDWEIEVYETPNVL